MHSKKLAFPKILIIFLAIAILVLAIILFGCMPAGASGNAGFSGSASNGSSGASQALDAGPPPVVAQWELPVVVSITGVDSTVGLAAAWGFDFGVKAVNESGGIRGVPVKITVKDAASNEATVRSEINAFSSNSLIMIAPSTEHLFNAGEQSFFSAKMPAVGAATDSERRDVNKPFAISCIADPNSASVSAAETWVRTEQFDSVYMFYAPANEKRTAGVEVALIAAEKTIVGKSGLGSESFDAASAAEKAMASGAEAFYIDMSGENTFRIIAQLKHLAGENADSLKILCGPGAADSNLIESAVDGEFTGVSVWTTFDPVRGAEKRKAFNEAFANHVDDPSSYSVAVDYYQAAFLLKQAIEMTGVTGAPDALQAEREKLAEYIYDAGYVSTDLGDFMIENGSKYEVAKIYTITEEGFVL